MPGLIKRAGVLLGLLCLVTACSGSLWSDDKEIRAGRGCPQVAILRPLAQTPPESAKPDPAIPVLSMVAVQAQPCRYEDESLDVRFALDFVARHQAKGQDRHLDAPFIIAVVDPHGTVIAKTQYNLSMHLDGEEALSGHQENLRVQLPVRPDVDGALYRVLTGFQLDEKHLNSKSESFENASRPVVQTGR